MLAGLLRSRNGNSCLLRVPWVLWALVAKQQVLLAQDGLKDRLQRPCLVDTPVVHHRELAQDWNASQLSRGKGLAAEGFEVFHALAKRAALYEEVQSDEAPCAF